MSDATQSFKSHAEWVNMAQYWLTAHPEYDDKFFRAICFDSLGRICRNGGDMKRAQNDNAFPVYWIWPDQNLFSMVDSIPRVKQ